MKKTITKNRFSDVATFLLVIFSVVMLVIFAKNNLADGTKNISEVVVSETTKNESVSETVTEVKGIVALAETVELTQEQLIESTEVTTESKSSKQETTVAKHTQPVVSELKRDETSRVVKLEGVTSLKVDPVKLDVTKKDIVKSEVVQEETTIKKEQRVETKKEESLFIPLSTFIRRGVVNWSNYKFTYYSQSVLPGHNLKIPGRHVNSLGYVVDGDGYIVLANSAPIGTVIDTPFGSQGKVYDRGTSGNHFDVYIR